MWNNMSVLFTGYSNEKTMKIIPFIGHSSFLLFKLHVFYSICFFTYYTGEVYHILWFIICLIENIICALSFTFVRHVWTNYIKHSCNVKYSRKGNYHLLNKMLRARHYGSYFWMYCFTFISYEISRLCIITSTLLMMTLKFRDAKWLVKEIVSLM